jgi:hypothetical protein
MTCSNQAGRLADEILHIDIQIQRLHRPANHKLLSIVQLFLITPIRIK